MLTGTLALTTAAAFTGAAFYVGFAEQPARLQLDDSALLREWQPSYKSGYVMQATLALVGFALGAAAWHASGDARWLAGGLALVANWPYTLLVIKPTNDRLMAMAPEKAGLEARTLIETWGRLHAVRTGLGALATAIFLWASL